MTFDDYCKATGHYAEAGDRAMWEAATKAAREVCKARALKVVGLHRNDYNDAQINPILADIGRAL